MFFNTFVQSQEDILDAAQAPDLREVLIEPAKLAREGKLTREQSEALAVLAGEHNIKSVLVWDILMSGSEFDAAAAEFSKYNLDLFSAVRVQCPGAALWLSENYPKIKIHFIAENGNNNFPSLQTWCENLKPALERLILNIQLTEEKLIEYIPRLPVECEILGAGRILLFYSARKLLRDEFKDIDTGDIENPWREVDAASEDSHNRKFPIIENNHGTFMYLDKDQYILDRLDKLKAAGLKFIRLDLRHLSEPPHAAQAISELCKRIIRKDGMLKDIWPREIKAPFFKSNLTTRQFKKLKTKTKIIKGEDCLAEVVSCESGERVAFIIRQSFAVDAKFKLYTPQGAITECQNLDFRLIDNTKLNECPAEKLVTSLWIKGAVPGAILKLA